MRVLHLTLKKKWFDMIASGEKKEEYREIKMYWLRRLCTGTWPNMIDDLKKVPSQLTGTEKETIFDVMRRDIDTIWFDNGYGKDVPRISVECLGIDIGTGNPDWGAEPGKEYFVIKLGKIINI